MSKTMIYILTIITVYLLIIVPKISPETEKTEEKEDKKTDTKNALGLHEEKTEKGVVKGAAGQMSYRIGYVK